MLDPFNSCIPTRVEGKREISRQSLLQSAGISDQLPFVRRKAGNGDVSHVLLTEFDKRN